MVDLLAQGDQRHAAYADADDGFTNAVQLLARDLIKLDSAFQARAHPVLGKATATATMVEAGVSRNITPPVARAVLDIRSTPDWTHEELASELRSMLTSDVIVTSRRLTPCETPSGSRLLATASRLRPEAAHFGSPTCSDWVFFGDRDAIKCGPGTSRRSHTADEYVDIPEVTAARAFYGELVRAYLSGH
jgi:acetylornithine deacetylase